MNLHLSNSIIGFDDTRFKELLVRKEDYVKKIKYVFEYLKAHVPVNIVTNENTFDFSKLKTQEGKNYDWFYLINDKAEILVRQYRNHFTIFSIGKKKESYFNKLSIFTIHDDFERITDNKLHDRHCDNPFLTFETLIPQIFETVEKDKVNGMWNSLSFVRPEFTKVKIGFVSEDSVYSLDDLVFACDELFQKYLEKFAENDLLTRIKQFVPGDVLGGYTITKVKTEVEDGYYHSAGLKFYRTNDEKKKEEWNDVYSLTRYHFEDIYFGKIGDDIKEFIYENHDVVFPKVLAELIDKQLFFNDIIFNCYYKIIFDLYRETHEDVENKYLIKFVSKDFNKFLYHSFMMERKKHQKSLVESKE